MDKVTLKGLLKYDDPVGIWYECTGCKKDLFIPDWDLSSKETDVFKFCSYCGKEVEKINSNGY
jgi:DNA-directed RNA polymerase subunit RPC12/RpoP